MRAHTLTALAVASLSAQGPVTAAAATSGAAEAQGIVDDPCPPPLPLPDFIVDLRRRNLDPSLGPADMSGFETPEVAAYSTEMKRRSASDWPNLCRYRADNLRLKAEGASVSIVFMGDSITENWVAGDPELFLGGVIGRGVSGQTSPQMLGRFQADVIALRPRIVHILAGTNDVAGNTGPSTLGDVQNNIRSMVQIAQANGLVVVLGSTPPAASFWWRPELEPAQTIRDLNAWIKTYAAETGAVYADYYAVLASPEGAMRGDYSADGVHPSRAGYAAMAPVARAALAQAEMRRR